MCKVTRETFQFIAQSIPDPRPERFLCAGRNQRDITFQAYDGQLCTVLMHGQGPHSHPRGYGAPLEHPRCIHKIIRDAGPGIDDQNGTTRTPHRGPNGIGDPVDTQGSRGAVGIPDRQWRGRIHHKDRCNVAQGSNDRIHWSTYRAHDDRCWSKAL